MTCFRWLGAALLLIQWGCSGEMVGAGSPQVSEGSWGAKEGAIIDGVEDTDSDGVMLLFFNPIPYAPYPLCTGTLIAPNLILTAQHCVADLVDYNTCGYGSPYNPANLLASTEDTGASMENIRGISEVHVPPTELTPPVCGNDIALLVLEEAIPAEEAIPYVPRVDVPMGNEELYSAVGYGYTGANGQGAGVRRRIDNLTSVCVEWYCGQPTLQNEWIGPGKICEGDSGGPALDTLNRQVGIASSYLGINCENAYSLYSHIHPWADWLKEKTIALTESGGIATPPWATGWPTDPAYSYDIGANCTGDSECESGICVQGICTRMCNDDAPCPGPYYCPPATAICMPLPIGDPCDTPEDCLSLLCGEEGFCTVSCNEEWPCPEDTICNEGQVCGWPVEESCSDTQECEVGWCVDGECVDSCDDEVPCPDGWVCMEDTGACEPVTEDVQEPEEPTLEDAEDVEDVGDTGDPGDGEDSEDGIEATPDTEEWTEDSLIEETVETEDVQELENEDADSVEPEQEETQEDLQEDSNSLEQNLTEDSIAATAINPPESPEDSSPLSASSGDEGCQSGGDMPFIPWLMGLFWGLAFWVRMPFKDRIERG